MKYNNQIINDLFSFFRQRAPLPVIILINIIIYLIINIINVGIFLADIPAEAAKTEIISWLAVPSNIYTLLNRPWTLITYMFFHEEFFHIFFNMLLLYFGGKLFIQYVGVKRLTTVYLLGGITGAFFFIAAYNIFPVFSSSYDIAVALGASASVLAVLTAVTTFIPDYSVNLLLFGKVKLKYLIILLLLVDVLSINKSNPGGHIAHLGGALFGFSYIFFGKMRLFGYKPLKNMFKIFKRPKLKKTYTGKAYHERVRKMNDNEYNAMKTEKQKKIDVILDKISRSGYESLTHEEKEFLFSQSKNNL